MAGRATFEGAAGKPCPGRAAYPHGQNHETRDWLIFLRCRSAAPEEKRKKRMYVLTNEQMQKVDEETILTTCPGIELMERAGKNVALFILKKFEFSKKLHIL